MFSKILKANPYHDKEGQFTSKDKASSASKTVHRGVGKGSSSTGSLVWVTEDKDLAKGYADARGGGSVETFDVEMKSTFEAGHDAMELTPSKFAVNAMMQAKEAGNVTDKEALALRKDFKEGQPEDVKKISDLWADEEGKKRVSTLLKGLGFDSIHLLEGEVSTYGLLNHKAKKDDMTQADLNVAGRLNPQLLGSRKRPPKVKKSDAPLPHPDYYRYFPRLQPEAVGESVKGHIPPVCGVRGRY